jgi:DNA polymerase III subunit delta'
LNLVHPWNEPLLRTVLRRNAQLPHALLIHGPRGIGKLALAERIAAVILCETRECQSRPCGACGACRWLAAGNHPDFRRLEPEALSRQMAEESGAPAPETPARKTKPSSEIRIEQVRELADFLGLGSHRGRSRIALVHPAEDMNVHAANSLLKGLEEPPAGAMFLLVSHRPARLLPTIRSRCIAVPVAPPPRDAALRWLSEQGVADPDRWLAFAGGAPLRALEYANASDSMDRLLRALDTRDPAALPPLEDREQLETLADALQKLALDRALVACGLQPKYCTTSSETAGTMAAWLAFARRMGKDRALCRHPLNPRLFASAMLAGMPR